MSWSATVPAKMYLRRASLVKFNREVVVFGFGTKVSGMNFGPRPRSCPVPMGGLLVTQRLWNDMFDGVLK